MPGPTDAGKATDALEQRGLPSVTASRMKTTGTAMATSFSQNWNACTKVIERMPPAATTMPTMTATATDPAHGGSPVVMLTVRAAPCSWGTM